MQEKLELFPKNLAFMSLVKKNKQIPKGFLWRYFYIFQLADTKASPNIKKYISSKITLFMKIAFSWTGLKHHHLTN
jgi:hypothetical protein